MSFLRRGAVTLAFVATSLAALPARAEPTAASKETARALAEQGDERFAAHDYEAALKLYAAAHKTMGVPTTGVRLARTQEALNLLVEARDTFLAVTRFAVLPGEPAVFTSARAESQREADALAARIPSVVVKVLNLPAGATPTVKVDDETLPPEASTLPHKVNPGAHHLVVGAPGFQSGTADIAVREGETGHAEVALTASPNAPQVATSGASRASTSDVPPEHGGALRTASYVVAGAGLVGLGVGTAFGVDALSKKNARNANCNAAITVCNQAGIDADSQGRSSATASTIAFAAGAVGVGAGVVLWLVSRHPTEEARTGALVVVPAVGSNGGGVLLQGGW